MPSTNPYLSFPGSLVRTCFATCPQSNQVPGIMHSCCSLWSSSEISVSASVESQSRCVHRRWFALLLAALPSSDGGSVASDISQALRTLFPEQFAQSDYDLMSLLFRKLSRHGNQRKLRTYSSVSKNTFPGAPGEPHSPCPESLFRIGNCATRETGQRLRWPCQMQLVLARCPSKWRLTSNRC